MTKDIATNHHDWAEEAAGLSHLDGSAWHAYRRAHDSSLMHHSPAVVAASTGRRNVGVMLERYMKPNRASIYEALTHRKPLREGAE